MEISKAHIDGGAAFDWGRTSADYARYRDIYPPEFYERIYKRGLCVQGQAVLDIGTGTGVLPRNLYSHGADWTGADISENQIAEARRLAEEQGQSIRFVAAPAEELDFPEASFDVITACQCYWYFDFRVLAPRLARMLKPKGRLLLLEMEWLPYDDKLAQATEELVLKYNPGWSGAGETRHPIAPPPGLTDFFEPVHQEEFDLDVPFTRESWNGRIKACRGIGASLSPEKVSQWEAEHRKMLEESAPEEFTVKHFAAMLELKRR